MRRYLAILFFLAGCGVKLNAPVPPVTTETIQQIEADRNAEYSALILPTAPVFGIDFLGAGSSRETCDSFIQNTPRGFAGGIFYDAFKDARTCILRMCQSHIFSRIRVHLNWADNHGCDPSQFDAIARKAAALDPIAASCGVPVEVSGWCEDQCPVVHEETLRAKVLHSCPHCAAYVNASMSGTDLSDAVDERHDGRTIPRGRFQVSFDGKSAADADVESWKRRFANAEIRFLWVPQFNGRNGVNDKTPREQRTGWPSAQLIRAVADLAQPAGRLGSLPPGCLWKAISETWGSGKGHPVLICPGDHLRASIVDLKNRVIANAQYAGAYISGGFRYYFPLWGYEMASNAKRLTGDRRVYLRVSGKNYGPIDPGKRAGSFR